MQRQFSELLDHATLYWYIRKIMNIDGKVIWITGLSGAGKTTLAREVVKQLRELKQSVVFLDGDKLREVFGVAEIQKQNFDKKRRLFLGKQYGQLCRLIASQNINVVIATINLFTEVHQWNRHNLPGYFEVYLKVPIEELRRIDSKNIYSRFEAGKLSHVVGLDLPFDEPKLADWTIEYNNWRPTKENAQRLLEALSRKYPDD